MSRDPVYWPYTDIPWEMRECEHWPCETAKYTEVQAGGHLKRCYVPPVAELATLF